VALAFLLNFIRFLLIGLELIILVRVLLSWIDPGGKSPVAAFVIQTSEPILAPVRRLLPRTGMFDLAPMIVILVLIAIQRVIG
jgi:YggT family protein